MRRPYPYHKPRQTFLRPWYFKPTMPLMRQREKSSSLADMEVCTKYSGLADYSPQKVIKSDKNFSDELNAHL